MIDLSVLLPICIFQSLTGSYHALGKQSPNSSIFSLPVIFSVFGAIMIQLAFQLIPYFTIKEKLGQDFVQCKASKVLKEEDPPCSTNTVLYLISYMQYIICSVSFSIGKPFKKEIWTNYLYSASLLIMLIYTVYLMFYVDIYS